MVTEKVKRKKPEGSGRRTSLTSELVDQVCAYIREGRGIVNAYAKAGVPKTNMSLWMKKGKEDSEASLCSLYAYAYDQIDMAKSETKGEAEVKVYRGEKEWQSAARWLEAHDKETWSHRQEVAGTGEKGEFLIKVVEDGNDHS